MRFRFLAAVLVSCVAAVSAPALAAAAAPFKHMKIVVAHGSGPFSTPLVAGDTIFTYPATGETTWASDGRRGENSFLIAGDDLVLSIGVDGELDILSIENGEAQLVANYPAAESSVCSHPALLERHLLVKDQTHLRLWELSAP